MKANSMTMITMMLALAGLISTAQAADQKAPEKKSETTAAAQAPAALQQQPAQPTQSKRTTDVSFEDVLVQGKYHFSDEAVTTVEQDKILDALLGVRTDFKDRLKKSAARH